MKKIIRIFFITIGAILVLLITLPIVFKSRIEAFVKVQINQSIEATVDWNKFSINFFRGFPNLSVNLHDFSLVGKAPFEGDTLAAIQRFEFRVNPFSAIKKEVDVNSILLDRPFINGIVLADGTANWDIAKKPEPKSPSTTKEPKAEPDKPKPEKDVSKEEKKPAPSESSTESGTPNIGLSLKKFAITGARISYYDATSNTLAAVEDMNLTLKGDFAMDETELDLELKINGIQARSGGIRYMRDGNFSMEVLAGADLVNNVFTLKKNEIQVNGLTLGAEGQVTMHENGAIETDLAYFTRETTFKTLLSMVPAIYLADFESLETSGRLELNGEVKGMLQDSILPNVTLNLVVSDGYFAYSDLPKNVSDVQIDLHVNYRGDDMDKTTVNLNRFQMMLGGNPFDMKASVSDPISDMLVSGMVKGRIDFTTLKDVIPLEDIELAGKLEADLNWDTRLSYIEEERFEDVNLNGLLVIEDVLFSSPDIPVPVELQRMDMAFTPRYVNLNGLDLLIGSSDIHVDGALSNFIPYVFDKQTVSGSLTISSNLLDANELLTESEAPEVKNTGLEKQPAETESETAQNNAAQAETVQDKVEENNPTDAIESPTDTDEIPPLPDTYVPSTLKIPENIDFSMNLDMKKVVYDNIIAENIRGIMKVKDGIADLELLKVNILEGEIEVSGEVDTRGEYTDADVSLDMLGIDIPASYEMFVSVKRLAPIAQHTYGNANIKMQLKTLIDGNFEPIYDSIDAKGHLFARSLKVESPNSLEKLSSMLKNEKLRNMELEGADIRFRIENGRVIVDPFDIDFDDSRIGVSGSHGIDMTLDYLLDMEIAKKDLGSGANELLGTVSGLASAAGIPIKESDMVEIKATIQGTFKDPVIRTDLKGNLQSKKEEVKEVVKEKVMEEVKKVEEEVREDVSQKTEKLISDAEEQAARLVAEARKRGDQLVAEAEKQGDNLIDQAGANPIKRLAAEKAADKLVKEAQEKADAMVNEAQNRADQIIQKAREEADKI